LLIDREDLVKDDKIENGENDIEIADYADFFLINYAGRGAEGFAENDKIEGDENDIKTANCADFFLINYTDRCAVSLYSANLIIIIAAAKTASIYRF
jgi:hypothetical protein